MFDHSLSNQASGAARRRAVLASSCALLATALGAAAPARAADGLLFVTSSRYAGNANTVMVGQSLPNSGGVKAIADGSYPGVFANDTVDGNFGITAPILLESFPATDHGTGGVTTGPQFDQLDITQATGVTTSFSSKSELSVHLSTDSQALTLMGYPAAINMLDISNSNTPNHVDPTNTDIAPPTRRAVVQVDLGGGLPTGASVTPTNSYSGNNGRGAILARNVDSAGIDEYLMVGNAGNGSGTPPTSIVRDTGVQVIQVGSRLPSAKVVGQQQGSPGNAVGYEYGFTVTSLGYAPDKSGKDDNFRGSTVFFNTLFVTKGSGGNGVNTVYQVTPPGGGLPLATDPAHTRITILPGLPAGLATNIVEGDPKTEFYPFGIWFANATTLYVADEGSQDLNADPNAGLQKWIFDGSNWNLAYVIQAGLNLDQPYTVAGYPSQDDPAYTGLRNLAGVVSDNTVTLFATTATYSNLGDPGADPNSVVRVVDTLDATTLPKAEHFSVVRPPQSKIVYRGVAYLPTN